MHYLQSCTLQRCVILHHTQAAAAHTSLSAIAPLTGAVCRWCLLQWRRDFDIKGLMKERFPPELTSLGCVYGRDKTGGPVTYNTYGNMDVDKVFGIPGGVGKFIR